MSLIEFFDEELTPEVKTLAEKELGENEEVKMRCLKEIKILIKDVPDFEPCMDDVFLLRFLRIGKFNVQEAFEKLQKYYIYKAEMSGIVTDGTLSEILPALELNHISAMKYRNENGVGVVYIRYNEYAEIFSMEGSLSCCAFFIDNILSEPTQITGYAVIFDYTGFNFSMAMKCSDVKMLYNMAKGVKDYLPYRIKAIHIINQPYYVTFLYAIIEKFLPEVIRNRVHFHGDDLDSLYKHVSPEILPEELGGHQGPVSKQAKETIDRLVKLNDHAIKMQTYGFIGETYFNLVKGNPRATVIS